MEDDIITDSQIASILASDDEEYGQRVESDEESDESAMDFVFRKVEGLVMDEGTERKKSIEEMVQQLGRKSAVMKKALELRLDSVEDRIAALEIQ